MDLEALLKPLIEFFSSGIGAVIANIVKALYAVLYPANAEAATPLDLGN
ncbi:hypothetical protein [Corynebacterium caspium]|nr:hypothetical protein [Corynebacterium caspium]